MEDWADVGEAEDEDEEDEDEEDEDEEDDGDEDEDEDEDEDKDEDADVADDDCDSAAASMDVAAAAAANACACWLITVYCDFFASSFTPILLNREEETTEPINHTKHIVIMCIHHNMTSTTLFTRWQNDSRTRRDGESLIA